MRKERAERSDHSSSSTPSVSTSNRSSARSSNAENELHRKKKEAIVSFLYRIAEDCGDRMPNKSEVHLPFHLKKELYPVFLEEFKRLHPTLSPPSGQYFRRIWKLHCPTHKVMKSHRFSTCDECDSINRVRKEAIFNGHSTEVFKKRRRNYLNFVFRERTE